MAAEVGAGIAGIGEIAETAGRKSANSRAAAESRRRSQHWQVRRGVLPFERVLGCDVTIRRKMSLLHRRATSQLQGVGPPARGVARTREIAPCTFPTGARVRREREFAKRRDRIAKQCAWGRGRRAHGSNACKARGARRSNGCKDRGACRLNRVEGISAARSNGDAFRSSGRERNNWHGNVFETLGEENDGRRHLWGMFCA